MAANSGDACRVMSGDAAARSLGPDVCRRDGPHVCLREPERRRLASAATPTCATRGNTEDCACRSFAGQDEERKHSETADRSGIKVRNKRASIGEVI
jgi:hypothetical protein